MRPRTGRRVSLRGRAGQRTGRVSPLQPVSLVVRSVHGRLFNGAQQLLRRSSFVTGV